MKAWKIIGAIAAGWAIATQHPQSTVPTAVAKAPVPNALPCHADRARPAVVTLFAGSKVGTGSLVHASGLALTNAHVVSTIGINGTIYARQWDGKLSQGRVLAVDRVHDLAIVKINAPTPLPTLAFATTPIQRGQAVCAIGSPRAQTGVLVQGRFERDRSNGDLESAVRLEPGYSGGPLLNDQGALLGINKALLRSNTGENSGLSLATSGLMSRKFLEQQQSVPPTARHRIQSKL